MAWSPQKVPNSSVEKHSDMVQYPDTGVRALDGVRVRLHKLLPCDVADLVPDDVADLLPGDS